MKTKIEKLAGKMAEKFATSLHEDNDLGILTRHPNIRFSYLEGFNAALNIGRLEGAIAALKDVMANVTDDYNGADARMNCSQAISSLKDDLDKLMGGNGS